MSATPPCENVAVAIVRRAACPFPAVKSSPAEPTAAPTKPAEETVANH